MTKNPAKLLQIAAIFFITSAIMATIAFNMSRQVEEEILTPAPTSTVEEL